jgi:hypothetical protein
MKIFIACTGRLVINHGPEDYVSIIPTISEWKRAGKPLLSGRFFNRDNSKHSFEALQ